jgi:hypothetical protein
VRKRQGIGEVSGMEAKPVELRVECRELKAEFREAQLSFFVS